MSKDISEDLWIHFKERAKGHWKELSKNEIEKTKGKRD
jgi:hypothetical protein